VALTVWYLFQDKGAYLTPEEALDSEAEGLIETESLNAGDGVLRRYLPDESELDGSDQDKSREVASTDEQSLVQGVKEKSGAQEVLEQFAMENSWTEVEKRSNAGLWAEPCRQLLVSGNLLQPPFPEAGLSEIYLRLIEPVSVSLICWKLGGCSGARNPFVLRVCFSAYARSGLFCRDANSVQEALWQTLTPIEHEAYLAFLNQVISGVTAK